MKPSTKLLIETAASRRIALKEFCKLTGDDLATKRSKQASVIRAYRDHRRRRNLFGARYNIYLGAYR